jgi:RNA recognition motif-containing protein
MSSFDPAAKHPVKSLKISMNEDHTSRGYGFVCYETPEDAAKACEMMDESSTHQECIAVKWNPKDR